MISGVFWAFHVGHHHDHLADMMVNMKSSQSDEGGELSPERGADTSPGQARLRAPPWVTGQKHGLAL